MSDNIHTLINSACDSIGISAPTRIEYDKWLHVPVKGKAKSNTSGRVMVFQDGKGGVAWNWATGQQQKFYVGTQSPITQVERKKNEQKDKIKYQEYQATLKACSDIVSACRGATHPYFIKKGFATREGLVLDSPRSAVSDSPVRDRILNAMPQNDGPLLVIPGRINKQVTTLQFITNDGDKKNIIGGKMGGACCRISQGRETWVCEGIATAISVHQALKMLGRSVTVLCAFSANNVYTVASAIKGAVVAADHDKFIEQFNMGTGEYWARKSGNVWVMPPHMGDFNDMAQADGIRSVAVYLKGIKPMG